MGGAIHRSNNAARRKCLSALALIPNSCASCFELAAHACSFAQSAPSQCSRSSFPPVAATCGVSPRRRSWLPHAMRSCGKAMPACPSTYSRSHAYPELLFRRPEHRRQMGRQGESPFPLPKPLRLLPGRCRSRISSVSFAQGRVTGSPDARGGVRHTPVPRAGHARRRPHRYSLHIRETEEAPRLYFSHLLAVGNRCMKTHFRMGRGVLSTAALPTGAPGVPVAPATSCARPSSATGSAGCRCKSSSGMPAGEFPLALA